MSTAITVPLNQDSIRVVTPHSVILYWAEQGKHLTSVQLELRAEDLLMLLNRCEECFRIEIDYFKRLAYARGRIQMAVTEVERTDRQSVPPL